MIIDNADRTPSATEMHIAQRRFVVGHRHVCDECGADMRDWRGCARDRCQERCQPERELCMACGGRDERVEYLAYRREHPADEVEF
jgi:hypothetical protein